MTQLRTAILAIGYLLFAIASNAHPGHSPFEHGATHLLASPFHLLTFAVLALAFGVAAGLARSPHLRRGLHIGTALSIVVGAAWFFSR